MFDAVHVVVGAVRELNRSQEIGVKPLSCTSSLIWQHGTSLMNYLRMVRVAMDTLLAAILWLLGLMASVFMGVHGCAFDVCVVLKPSHQCHLCGCISVRYFL